MLFNKPITEIEESDLQTLIDNRISERKTIEYKRDLPGNNYKDRKEFLADISSFANTVGGYLIYGIDAKDGIPIELCGVELASIDNFKLTCENRLRDGLSPQIPPFNIQHIEINPNKYIIILHIPRSWLIPHRVTLENHGHFYGRNSAGHFQMDVPQLRTAFELSGTLAERIRNFRAERLSRIATGEETPVPLHEQEAKLVLHLIPLDALNAAKSLDLKPLNDAAHGLSLNPLLIWDFPSNVDMRFNIDGLIRAEKRRNPSGVVAYTQIFRNGIIETVDISLLGTLENKSLHGERYERKLVEAVKRYTDVQQLIGTDPPFFIMVSFLGVKGYKIVHPNFDNSFFPSTDEIDRNNLIIPEVMVDNFDANLAEVMKPIFDIVWNAAGRSESINYDADGKFLFGY